ncbi:MAG: hypothetical protein K2X69_14640, partial [Silvanigrellaceae bacterium]|nr:hypothetical protein [Silvanigrellaceae bacterium]
ALPIYLLRLNPKDEVLLSDGQIRKVKKVEFDTIKNSTFVDVTFDKKVTGYINSKLKSNNQLYYSNGSHIEEENGSCINIISIIERKNPIKLTDKYSSYTREDLIYQLDNLIQCQRKLVNQ